MAKDYKIDVLLINGDLVGHEIAVKPALNLTDEQTEQHYKILKDILQTVSNEFVVDNFPDAVVLPTLGNNDVWHPILFTASILSRVPSQKQCQPQIQSRQRPCYSYGAQGSIWTLGCSLTFLRTFALEFS